ncbi:hypothetical protein [Caballeronia glebae]|uniref:hypothetical protein n=1 Tax=Caballeronia glebae TaxID=1777143 RepID=UPI0038BD5545
MPKDAFDPVVSTLSSSGGAGDANAQGIAVKAGDLIGHLGSFEPSSASSPSATRMAHIEAFCDESVESTSDDVDRITKGINPGLFSHKPNQPISAEIWRTFKIDEITSHSFIIGGDCNNA